MPEILIDICLPTNNSNAEYVCKAIESALAQTERRWHMYVRDNHSEVDVRNIIGKYMKDERISFHPGGLKGTIGENWNRTMRLGKAPFVQFLFQDDWWEPWFLERALKAMEEHPAVGIVSLEHTYVTEGNPSSISLYTELEKFRRENIKEGKHDGMEILRWWIERELHPNILGEPDFVFLRRSLMEKAGPYLEDMPQNLDMEYSIRCLQEADWYYVKENCGYFRVHGAAESAVNQREGKGVFDRFRCFEELIKRLPAGPDRKLAIAARNRALTDMAKKFLNRMKAGGQVKVSGGSGGAFKKFAMSHPFLVLGALWRAWRN
jgi:glycosyltransferase involved in cell wall biosynthesis